ncbi:hypothetical protein EJ04DRAFT_45408 [Polyplosphaeria fusca]|uniref:Uncharacterized protein n=1 Tax=Polyplosphaeria fusca TaxID=682080 RepID=A0A9P4UVZ4_9PLEO|nr:hypothetical protein EJ04DRAFT_45408 [Polyplosphaeria fusca]
MTSTAKRDSMDATVDDVKTGMQELDLAQAPRKRALGLTDLPPTVRNNIYKYCLDTELVNVGLKNVSYTHQIKEGLLQFKSSRSPFPVHTGLFSVDRKLGAEASRFFYEKNLFIRFKLYTSDARHAKTMLEESGLLFSASPPSLVEMSTRHAMDLTLVEKNSGQKRAEVMFPAQYLPRLINFLDQASHATSTWAQNHSVFITVLNRYSFSLARLQGDLLEPWRLLTNLGAVTIDPDHLLPGYAQSLAQSMITPLFSPEAWLDSLHEVVELAAESFSTGEYKLAEQYVQSATIGLTYGYLTRAEVLHSQPETFSKRIQRLRWRCELGIAKALTHLHRPTTENTEWLTDAEISASDKADVARDLISGERAASRALSLATDSPSPNTNPWFVTLPAELIPPNKLTWFNDIERSSSWLVLGTVHMALGENLFAAGDCERAMKILTDDGKKLGDGEAEKAVGEVEEVFAKARDGIDWNMPPGRGLNRAARLARS